MKKVFLFAFIMSMLCNAIFCDDTANEITQSNEIVYMVIQESRLDDPETGRGIAIISEGEQVFYQGRIKVSTRNIRSGVNGTNEILVRTEQGQEGWIEANHILLKDNQPLSSSVAARRWIFSYYQDIIFERQGVALYKYEPFWLDDYNEAVKYTAIGGLPWWGFFNNPTEFYIRNNLVMIKAILLSDYIDFATTKQEQDNTSILIQCICTYKRSLCPQSHWNTIFNTGEMYQFVFKIDGDYMDVFLDDNPVKICTLIGVDDYFMNVVTGIVQGEYVDLTRIIWPRRADGSMDYPPPLNMSNYIATHRTTDSLRLQDSANTAAKLVTTLPRNTEVQVIETGSISTISGISGSWVKVISSTGYTGWCFDVHLEEIKKPDISYTIGNTATEVSQTDDFIQSDKGSQSLPFGALIAIIGGVVVVAGGVVLFIVKRKK
ncbi:MAG: SH3 domain-containing protein [Treponema sp.]|jgi:hypothetical protein|nr:SH3 domain-containing protein [Treponema sp.]